MQLAAYRLGWSRLTGVPVERVSAGFHHVAAGVTLRPVDLLDEAGLLDLVTGRRRLTGSGHGPARGTQASQRADDGRTSRTSARRELAVRQTNRSPPRRRSPAVERTAAAEEPTLATGPADMEATMASSPVGSGRAPAT